MRQLVKPLARRPMLPLLVLLQVAVASAMACNIAFLLARQLTPLMTSDGIGDPSHLLLAYNIVARGKPFSYAETQAVEASLKAIPGARLVSTMPMLPMVSLTSANADVNRPGHTTKANAALYLGDHVMRTLRLRIVAGRDFLPEEHSLVGGGMGFHSAGPVIINRALARRLFPTGTAVGGHIVIDSKQVPQGRTVVGVVANLARNDLDQSDSGNDCAMFFPDLPRHWPVTGFAIRTEGHDSSLLKKVREHVEGVLAGRLFTRMGVAPYAQIRAQAQAPYRSAVWLLSGLSVVVLLISLAGIMGMTGYWVQQRTHTIGVRRALGARVAQIRREIQLENLLVVGAGLVLGVVAAEGLNLWLMQHYEVPRMPWTYLPVGAAVLLVLGQLAALAPAIRASRVPPVVATRAM
ncbi:FtsX-like permease family protein [Oleiagrimonas sp. C23AA]|uniref:ABC transporter permease n=1 Tax=Oleiagrimonas sp. C23AA TaxID=2719047 RepID=UPI001422B29C|nr:FtsX-like permease family protein [Oleiagrimonas sp. C23AA]NII12024.1 FtsX-like permease family protein [Oleiagrimonas sp. C23AA]